MYDSKTVIVAITVTANEGQEVLFVAKDMEDAHKIMRTKYKNYRSEGWHYKHLYDHTESVEFETYEIEE